MEAPKPKPGTPEWMKYIQAKALAKKQEQRKIRDAEQLRKKTEHEAKLKDAEQMLSPPAPVAPPTAQPEPKPKRTRAPRRTLDVDTPNVNETINDEPLAPMHTKTVKHDTPDFQQLYYERKLQLLEQKQQATPVPVSARPLPYEMARAQIHQDVQKSVMDNLYKSYWQTDRSPYA
jgi:hypothetical protein